MNSGSTYSIMKIEIISWHSHRTILIENNFNVSTSFGSKYKSYTFNISLLILNKINEIRLKRQYIYIYVISTSV